MADKRLFCFVLQAFWDDEKEKKSGPLCRERREFLLLSQVVRRLSRHCLAVYRTIMTWAMKQAGLKCRLAGPTNHCDDCVYCKSRVGEDGQERKEGLCRLLCCIDCSWSSPSLLSHSVGRQMYLGRWPNCRPLFLRLYLAAMAVFLSFSFSSLFYFLVPVDYDARQIARYCPLASGRERWAGSHRARSSSNRDSIII